MIGVDVEFVATHVNVVYLVCQFVNSWFLSSVFLAFGPLALLGYLEVVIQFVVYGGLDAQILNTRLDLS